MLKRVVTYLFISSIAFVTTNSSAAQSPTNSAAEKSAKAAEVQKDGVQTAAADTAAPEKSADTPETIGKTETSAPAGKTDSAAAEEEGSMAEIVRQNEIKSVEESYSVRLKTLESKVNELKEKIFRSKARLTLLAETVISGALTGAKASIYHRNEMSSSFVLKSVTYTLDGTPIYTKVDKDGSLADEEEIEILNAPVVPGNHSISVSLLYSGNGYGIFSYLDGYRFKVKSSYVFQAQEGKITNVKVVGYERGGMTLDLKERPSVRYDVKIETDIEGIKKAKESLQENEGDEEI